MAGFLSAEDFQNKSLHDFSILTPRPQVMVFPVFQPELLRDTSTPSLYTSAHLSPNNIILILTPFIAYTISFLLFQLFILKVKLLMLCISQLYSPASSSWLSVQ